jgi:hypothetical protein
VYRAIAGEGWDFCTDFTHGETDLSLAEVAVICHKPKGQESAEKSDPAGCQWLMPVILATQEAEIRRITSSMPAQANSFRDPILKKPITNKGLVEWLKR